jgi:hypothetical protein
LAIRASGKTRAITGFHRFTDEGLEPPRRGFCLMATQCCAGDFEVLPMLKKTAA